MNYFFTSESVSEGHPDKIADQISDRILDAYLAKDPHSRVACETMISTDFVIVSGEVSSKAQISHSEIEELIKDQIKSIGYDDKAKGFDYKNCEISIKLDEQSPDIAQGVNRDSDLGAGDQGIMFGYAVKETDELMPLTIQLSHQLMFKLAQMRKSQKFDFLRPDSKAQVTVEYDNQNKIKRISNILVSTQHSPDISQKELRSFIIEELISQVIPKNLTDNNTQILVNPTGQFIVGGPKGDCGLTGRKIIVDTYGGHGSHGGGAFSGKDPTKVDRSAAYMARHIAKNIVAAGLAERCLLQLSYAIGEPEPISFYIQDYATSPYSQEVLSKAVKEIFNCRLKNIITHLDLLRPIYTPTASYGHFGRSDQDLSWEKVGHISALKDVVKTLS